MAASSDRQLRRGALLISLAVVLATSCSESRQPFAPIGVTPSAPTPHAGAVIYQGVSGLSDASSRYVLYDDSTFALEFTTGVYLGRYRRTDSRIVFSWEGWSTMGPWGAEATLRGDSLKVTYNVVMAMSDFVDGTYIRKSAAR